MAGCCQVYGYLSPHPTAKVTWPSSVFPDAGKESLPGEFFFKGFPTYSFLHSTIIV